MILYHGTSASSAQNIIENGVDQNKSGRGYFGAGFYLAEEWGLAKSNYADFSDDEGAVLACEIDPCANILDLSRESHFQTWKNSGLEALIARQDFWAIATRKGVDGVKDASFGGIVIYNPAVILEISIATEPEPAPPRARPFLR